jgi:galactoside O-acetyltransferase
MEKTDDGLVERIAALEAELAAVKARLDESSETARYRNIKTMFAARTCQRMWVLAAPIVVQPTLFLGEGQIFIGRKVSFGVGKSPFLLSGYGYVEARTEDSRIVFGDDIYINNNFVIFSEGEGIDIGSNTLMGTNVEITDSDGHDLSASGRISGKPRTGKVTIGKNVFIGSNVRILRSVVIGDNSVIGNGSIVTTSIPANMIAAGNPAKPIRPIPQ